MPDYAVSPPKPRRAAVVDASLILATATVNVGGTLLAAQHQPGARLLDPLGVGLLLIGPIILWWRRSHPVPVLAGCLAVTTCFLWLAYAQGPAYSALVVALVSAVIAGRRLAAYGTVVALVVFATLLPALTDGEQMSLVRSAGHAAWFLLLTSIGEVMRYRRALAAAERQRVAISLRAEADELQRRVAQDRLHLARELHDVLGHHLAVINVQATAGLELFTNQPNQVPQTLRAVRDASKNALVDVQAFLDSLHEPADEAPREPSPTIRDLDRLVAPARAGGVPVHASIHGTVRPLPATADLAASRVIQESLTNVMRHAGQPATWVRIDYTPDSVRLSVQNAGATVEPTDPLGGAAGQPGRGRGIAGMRARVRDLGGTLTAGPTSEYAWSVNTVLPLPKEEP